MNDKDMTIESIRKRFLQDSEEVLNEIRARTLGLKSDNVSADAEFLKKYWDAIVPMIHGAGDLKKIEASTTADIITMLKEGEITIRDAKDLMQLLSVQSDIEDIKALLVKVNQLTDGQGSTYNG